MDKVFAWAQRATPRPAFTSAANGAQYRVVVVPALSDNYQFLVINNASSEAVAVDCCDAPSILHQLQTERAILVAVLTTHFHADHSGGNEALAASQPGLAIFAGAADARRTPSCTNVIDDGDAVQLAGLRFKAMHTPGHTKGHTCFFLDDGVAQSVFTGDCIFVCGCGRFFEGSPVTMWASLGKLASLPAETRVFCGHEYTEGNLRFAVSLDPDDAELRAKLAEVEEQRKAGLATVPSTIADELRFNPFLRISEEGIARSLGFADASQPMEVLATMRRKKDTFTPLGSLITYALDLKAYAGGKAAP